MFPLTGKSFPSSSDELCRSIEDALGEVLSFPSKNGSVVTVEGSFPAIRKLKIDLSGASIHVTEPPPQPKPKGKRQPGIKLDKLDVAGHPILYEKSKADLDLTARGLSFDFAHGADGKAMLILTDAQDGNVEVKISKSDLQSMLLAIASGAAKQQGVTIQELQVDLKSSGPRSLEVEARIKAKKMVMSGVVMITGKADVDDDLVATLSELSCKGEGVIGTMACAFLQDKLKKANGKKFPLMTFSMGDVSLRDLKISTSPAIQIKARFGRE